MRSPILLMLLLIKHSRILKEKGIKSGGGNEDYERRAICAN